MKWTWDKFSYRPTDNETDLELCLLGSIHRCPKVMAEVSSIVAPEDFREERNRLLYEFWLRSYRENGADERWFFLAEMSAECERLLKMFPPKHFVRVFELSPSGSDALQYARLVHENRPK